MPHVQAAYESLSKDNRFALVGLSLDDKPEIAANYVAKHNLKGHQGFLGKESPMSERYGVTSIPRIMLIGPDGKLVANNLSGPGIKTAVRQALGILP
jgi:Thioredoxin-like